MMKAKKINIPRIIWITGVFMLLIVTLMMIVTYKINYEYLRKNYLYFYNCSDSVCTSLVENEYNKEELYSVYECEYDTCPSLLKVLNEDYLILKDNEINILYNYRNGKKITDVYEDYNLINDRYFIVKLNGYEGIIDRDNNIKISISYDELGYKKNDTLVGYSIDKIIVKKDNKYGIISIKTGEIIEKIEHKEKDIDELLKLINS